MHKKRYSFGIFLSIGILLLICLLLPTVKPIIQQNQVHYIIDAGHGFPDGGAVGIDGTTEQLLNLQIAGHLYALCPEEQTIMVRQTESGLSENQGSIRERKISDMKQRVKIGNQYRGAIWISIHMNTYTDSSVFGCQVFYKNNDSISKEIATKLQNSINEQLQPNHTKNVKVIPEKLYLFQNTDNPAILIECGFISNPDDLTKLKDENYQSKLAQLIFESVVQ